MGLRDLIEEVLLLQPDWSSLNTNDMARRGVIVRQEIPRWLRSANNSLQQSAQWAPSDLAVEGRDGTGPKTEIPWTRLYSARRSPSATNGWYVAFLFSALGDRCYLSLCHGATRWNGTEYKPRSSTEMERLMTWARAVLGDQIRALALKTQISLDTRRSNPGPS